jgi:hypothetical protein
MEQLVGFKLDMWDYLTFAALFICGVAFMVVICWLGGLPGRIAVARKHPEANAVKLLGWAGFLPVYPWMQAFIWAFKPTEVVDIRNFPEAEAKEIEREIAEASGNPLPSESKPAVEEKVPGKAPKQD